jgi:hypothetical protein
MDYYDIWFDLKDTSRDLDFAGDVARYLNALREDGRLEGWRLARRKLGFGPPGLGEFHLTIEVRDLGQLEDAFQRVATRAPDIEVLHSAVFSAVRNVTFGLFRDFPDPIRYKPSDG